MNQVIQFDHADHELEDHDRGLVFDLATLDRRGMLKLIGLGGPSVESDNVFGDDGGAQQVGTISGDVTNGYTVALTVPVIA